MTEQLALLFHYPDADHADELVEGMAVVRDAMAAVPGCLEVGIWRQPATGAAVAVSRWVSSEALGAARSVLTTSDLPIEQTAGEVRDRQSIVLEPAPPVVPPAPVCVVIYESADDVYETAPVHYPAHKARVDEFRARGELLLVGLFGDPREGSMAVFRTREAAEAFVAGDPFVLHGVVTGWTLRAWNEIYGI